MKLRKQGWLEKARGEKQQRKIQKTKGRKDESEGGNEKTQQRVHAKQQVGKERTHEIGMVSCELVLQFLRVGFVDGGPERLSTRKNLFDVLRVR